MIVVLFDLHLHSRFSVDALSKPETIVKICKENGWGFSLTDHNNMGAYLISGSRNVKKLAKKEGVFLVPGEEIKVLDSGERHSNKKVVGEVIAYFLSEPVAPSSFEEILDEVQSQGALLSCPHPFDWPRRNFKDFPKQLDNFDCMETYNARAYYKGLNVHSQKFFEKRAKRKLSCLGVSDAHTPEEIGNGLTEIDAENENEFKREIKKCRTRVIQNHHAKVWQHTQTFFAKQRWMKER